MSVSDGEKVNAAVTNAAYISRKTDSNTTAKVDFENTDPVSGSSIQNAQRHFNSIASYVGAMVNQVYDYLPTWASDSIGSASDPVKDRVEAVQAQVELNTPDIAENTSDISDLRSTTGTADGETDMGIYSGSLLNDNESAKQNIQQLETQVETNTTDISTNTTDISNLETLSGVAGATDLGVFTEAIISDNTDIKTALQELETALSAVTDALDFQGLWDADTNSPTLTSSTGTKGHFYIINVSGTTTLDGISDWSVGDWAVFDGSVWRKIDNTDAVNSVNGKTGTVVLDPDDLDDSATTNKFASQSQLDKVDFISVSQAVDLDTMESDIATNNSKVSADGSIDSHSDVDISTTPPTTDQVLAWNGSEFVPADQTGGGGTGEGGINYITNGNAEEDLSGWTTYDDGAVSQPVNGEGGGPSSQISSLTETNNLAMASNNNRSQTFTTVGSFDLKYVDVKFFNSSGATGNVRAEIWGVDGGGVPDPTNKLGFSEYKDVSTFQLTSTIEQFTFTTPVSLSSATQYAIVLNCLSVTGNIFSRYDAGAPYAGGTVYTSTDLSSWSSNAWDMYFNTYDVGGGLIPLTRTTVSSEILLGSASFKAAKPASDTQGSGFRYDFAIDPFFRGKKFQLELARKNDNSYSDGDYKVFIYDVDNTTLIPLVNNENNSDITFHNGNGKIFQARFYATDSLNYRLLIHCTTTSATAFDFYFDKVKVTPEESIELRSDGPVGEVIALASDVAPEDFLYCNGDPISRADYSDLFDVIGTKYGNGDGSTTFNLPDLRGLFLRGQNDGSGNDPNAGSRTVNNSGGNTGDNVGSEQGDVFGSHNHGGGSHTHGLSAGNYIGTFGGYVTPFNNGTSLVANRATTQTPNSTVIATNGGSETRPKNVYVRYYIRSKSLKTLISTTELLNQSIGGPIGEIIASGSATTPDKFLYCDGSAVSRTFYNNLFDQIGTAYGVGDGSTTFNLPNFEGYFLRGQNPTGSGPDASRTLGSTQTDLFKSHNHGGGSHTHNYTQLVNNAGIAGGTTGLAGATANTFGTLAQTTAGPNSTVIASEGGTETRPYNVSVRYYIRYETDFVSTFGVYGEYGVDSVQITSTALQAAPTINTWYIPTTALNHTIQAGTYRFRIKGVFLNDLNSASTSSCQVVQLGTSLSAGSSLIDKSYAASLIDSSSNAASANTIITDPIDFPNETTVYINTRFVSFSGSPTLNNIGFACTTDAPFIFEVEKLR